MKPLSRRRIPALSRLAAVLVAIVVPLLPDTAESSIAIASSGGTSIHLEPGSQHVEVDESASVSVLVDNVSGLYGVEFRLTFDPTRLQVRDADLETEGVQVSPGYFPDRTQGMVIANRADNSQGIIDYAVTLLAPAQPVSGSGTVASISFKATAPGECQIRLQNAKLATDTGEPIPARSRGGRITVGSVSTATAGPTTAPVASATATSTATATPSATASPTTVAPGPSPSQTATPAPSSGGASATSAAPSASGTPGPAVVPTATMQPMATLEPADFEVASTWFFAEGSTKPPFETWLLLQNPGGSEARVRISFMGEDGLVSESRVALGPTSRRSLLINEMVPDRDVSMMVEADVPVLAERAVYFGADGHDSVGIRSPARRWYLAEGSTQPPFQTWILIQNPGVFPAAASIRYVGEDRSIWHENLIVPPLSRASIFTNQVLPPVAFSTEIEADQPVVVERSTYLESGGGNSSPGVTNPSRSWYMAEGSTEPDVDTWILLHNPGLLPVSANLTAMMPDGTTERFRYLLPPDSRTSIYANDILPPTQFGLEVEGDNPIVVERATYFGAVIRASQASMASPDVATTWYLPEGSTAYPFHEYLVLLNPANRPVDARVTFMKEDGFGLTKDFPILPTSRLTIDVNREVPEAAVSARVTASGPIVVERSMYLSDEGGGTGTVGIPGG